MLYGHTDRLGAASDNLALSRRRANSVRAGLIHRGLPEGLITTEASGETRPLVETEDGAREPQNRRVEISFGPGPAPSAGQPHYAPPVSIVASVGHSERCRAGTVRLDLSTGRYTLRAPATWRTCRKAGFRAAVSTGVVAPGDLAAVRAAWRRADVESLEDPTCGRRNGMQRVVIGNGGSVILRVTRRTGTVVPPGNLGCWSEAALNLHQVLRRLFDPPPSR